MDIVIITLQQMKNRLEILDKKIYENDIEIAKKNSELQSIITYKQVYNKNCTAQKLILINSNQFNKLNKI